MNEPFDVFLKREHPGHCQLCLGEGRLMGPSPLSGRRSVVACALCNGTGESDAPLFTDADSVAFDEWNRKRVTP